MAKPRLYTVFFCENIVCDVNDDENIQISLIRARSFIYLSDQYVLNRSYVNDTSLVVITPN